VKFRPRRLGVLVVVALLPLSLTVAAPADAALAKVTGLKVITTGTKAPTTASLWFQWTWSSKPKKYELQVSSKSTFPKTGLRTKKVLRDAKKPAGGVQKVQVASLSNATKYYIRIRAIAGTSTKPTYSGWSAAKTGNTKARFPAKITGFTSTPGPKPGEVTIEWVTTGEYTTGFKFVTSLNAPKTGETGLKQATTTLTSINPKMRKYTFSAEKMAALGAPVESGNFLFGKIYSINKGTGGSAELRGVPDLNWLPLQPLGKPASGTGAKLVLANYNVLTYKNPKSAEDAWTQRVQKVVPNILAADPDVITLQEVTRGDISPGLTQSADLLDKLQKAQPVSRNYVYGRSTDFTASVPADGTQAQRIIYDANKYSVVPGDTCDDTDDQPSCAFDPGGDQRWATYLHLASVADPTSRFWVVSAHLNSKRDDNDIPEQARKTEIDGINTTMDALAGTEPIILGMDSNTWQAYQYGDYPVARDALIAHGYYDTSSSANVANRLFNYGYSTDNTKWYGPAGAGAGIQRRATEDGYAPRLDVIAVKNMPGSDDFSIDAHPDEPYPGSDHNLVRAEIKLPH